MRKVYIVDVVVTLRLRVPVEAMCEEEAIEFAESAVTEDPVEAFNIVEETIVSATIVQESVNNASNIPRAHVEALLTEVEERAEKLRVAMEGYRKERFAAGFDIASASKNELLTVVHSLREVLGLEADDA